MALILIIATLILCAVCFHWGRRARDPEVRRLEENARSLHGHLAAARSEGDQLKVSVQQNETALKQAKAINEQLHAFGTAQIKKLRQDGALLPSLVRWADKLREEFDLARSLHAQRKYASAPVAADRVREADARARHAERASNELRNRVDLYEAQAPWLTEYADLTVEEVLEGLRLDEDVGTAIEKGEDPVRIFLSGGEWTALDTSARNQLALDRFLDRTRARSAWAAGIEYERYVGFRYEQDGWAVEYHGATKGKSDLGIDLVCTKDAQTLVVQCKRLSPEKGLPMRENVIGQLYGAARFLAFDRQRPPDSVTPVVVTTYNPVS